MYEILCQLSFPARPIDWLLTASWRIMQHEKGGPPENKKGSVASLHFLRSTSLTPFYCTWLAQCVTSLSLAL